MSVAVDFDNGQAVLYSGEQVEYFYFVAHGEIEEDQGAFACSGDIVHVYDV